MRPSFLLAFATFFLAPAVARADVITLGSAGPTGLNLGVFVTGPTQFSASNSGTTFNTNLGLANGASTNVSGGGTLTGTLYVDPGAHLQSNFNNQFNVGAVNVQSLAQAVADVKSAASAAGALSPNVTYGAVGGSALTISSANGTPNAGGGTTTVVQISSISITNPKNNLTLSGGAGDYFIINVLGDIKVSNGQITTTGGLLASHILFNVLGSGVTLTNGTSVLTGTYLAPNVGQQISLSPGTVNGAIIGYTIKTASGPTVNGDVFSPPRGNPPPPPPPPGNPVPAPASVLLAAAGIGSLLLRRLTRRVPVAA